MHEFIKRSSLDHLVDVCLLRQTLFDTINRSGSGSISKQELKLFYTAFIDCGKLSDAALTAITEKSYNAMTSNGDTALTFHLYKGPRFNINILSSLSCFFSVC